MARNLNKASQKCTFNRFKIVIINLHLGTCTLESIDNIAKPLS